MFLALERKPLLWFVLTIVGSLGLLSTTLARSLDDSDLEDDATERSEYSLGVNGLGGSNYGWYRIDGCSREPYGVIANYHVPGVRDTVRQQLVSMYAAGQRRLRVPIFHARGLDSGTIMNSQGGNLSEVNRANLSSFLADVKSTGYVELMFSMHPQSLNDPPTWTSWNEDYYQENWNLIVNLRPIFASVGLLYRIDLLNEGIPTSKQTMLRRYSQRLWTDYTLETRSA